MEQPKLKILIVDDEEIVHETLKSYLEDSGHQVEQAMDGLTGFQMIEKNDYDLAIIDIRMPGMDGFSLLTKIAEVRPELSAVIMTGHGDMDVAIKALRLGAADFLTKPVKLMELDAVIEKATSIRSLRLDKRHLKDTIREIQVRQDSLVRGRRMVGESPSMKEARKQIQLAVEAKCDTILVMGETGTGKEVVAREIHFLGGKDDSPFIAVSCPAIPETLVESELFGHTKGSFTGATEDRPGAFELADAGTLLLDEVGDLSPSAQAKLLRVLETRTVRRVGGSTEKKVNLRVVAATNVPLAEMVEKRKFRQDLFYRLNLFTINLLPLRERKEDIVPLAELFLNNYAQDRGKKITGFSKEAIAALMDYSYPGNARELKNIIERSAILCRTGVIQPSHLLFQDFKAIGNSVPILGKDPEEDQLFKVLEDSKWNRKEAAKALGISYSSLRYKLRKLGIE